MDIEHIMVVVLTIICAITVLLNFPSVFEACSGARHSRHWPSTLGRIVAGEVVVYNKLLPHAGHYYQVRYCYTVGGQQFEGHILRFGYLNCYSRRAAGRHPQRYPVGAEVTVHYMPAAPQVSVLEPGLHRDLLVGLAGFLVGSAWVIYWTCRGVLSFFR